jgi:hypothetical protein
VWFSLGRIIKAKPLYIFVVATAFILFQLFLLLNSFSAIYRIYTVTEASGEFWALFWFFSEFTGEIGLILRFVGACLFVAFAWVLLKKKNFSFSIFRKAVLLEGVLTLSRLSLFFQASLCCTPKLGAQLLKAPNYLNGLP